MSLAPRPHGTREVAESLSFQVKLHIYCIYLFKNSPSLIHEASDLCQETLSDAIEQNTVRDSREACERYIYGIARNKFRSYIRRSNTKHRKLGTEDATENKSNPGFGHRWSGTWTEEQFKRATDWLESEMPRQLDGYQATEPKLPGSRKTDYDVYLVLKSYPDDRHAQLAALQKYLEQSLPSASRRRKRVEEKVDALLYQECEQTDDFLCDL